MIAPPKFSTVAARHGLAVNNCDYELGRLRHCDSVLVLDTNIQPWREFFVRASILTVEDDWKLFTLDYSNHFSCIVYGNSRIPTYVLVNLLKDRGLVIDLVQDCCYYRNQLE
jgi:hypothetical protein